MRSLPQASLPDPTVYPEVEKVGEDTLQRWILEMLRPILQRMLSARGEVALVGADQFIYWEQYSAHKTIAPDIYVLPGVAPDTCFGAWKIWETGVVPSFCLEVVGGRDAMKDYYDTPVHCAEMGAGELIVFDPRPRGRDRIRWQVWRRDRSGALVPVEQSRGDRVWSVALKCWLRVVGSGAGIRLRVALDANGDQLVPTPEEALETLRQEHAQDLAELERLRAKVRPAKRPAKRPR